MTEFLASATMSDMSSEAGVLTASEVATQLGVSSDTVNRWAAENLLPSFALPSGRRRFRQADVDDLIAGKNADSDERLGSFHEPSKRGVA